jgi:DNA invertase Pin-like site-specific DNA recombinase
MAQQHGYQIVEEYTDRISGAKAKRPGLDAMMSDGRRGRFDVVLVWASDRIARSGVARCLILSITFKST